MIENPPKVEIGYYDENKQGEEVYFRCPICNHLIEDLDEGEFSPCEHAVAVWVDVASGWEVIDDDLRDKWVEDDERMYSGEEEDWPYEWDADDPEEWGKRNIPCDRIIEINDSGMACGPCWNRNLYFFKKDVD